MPFKSEKQRRYLWANEPRVARKYAEHSSKKPASSKGKKRATKKK
jgi:hypothetical protein